MTHLKFLIIPILLMSFMFNMEEFTKGGTLVLNDTKMNYKIHDKTNVDKNTQPRGNLQIGNKDYTVEFIKNETTNSLLTKFPFSLKMKDLNSNEKYIYLEERLPTSPESVKQIKAGDIMLFGSDCLVIFYEDFTTSYSYTKIGHITDSTNLKKDLGKGSIEVKLSVISPKE